VCAWLPLLLAAGDCEDADAPPPATGAGSSAVRRAGFSGDDARRLRELGVSADELAQLARARMAGARRQTCVALVAAAHGSGRRFDEGDAVVRLRRAGARDRTIVELARLGQLRGFATHAVIMRRAGIRDQSILEIVRFRAAGLPVFSGESFARLKRAGARDRTLIELTKRAVPERDVPVLVELRRRGASDTRILSRYPRR